MWDLSLVPEALKAYPFETLDSADLKYLSLKLVFLNRFVISQMCDLHTLSVSTTRLEFVLNDSKVILKPRHGYVPKVMALRSEHRPFPYWLCQHLIMRVMLISSARSGRSEFTLPVPPSSGALSSSFFQRVHQRS